MKKTLLTMAAAVIAVTASVGSPAMAQGWQPDRDDHRGPDREWNDHGPRDHRPNSPAPAYRPNHPPAPPAVHGWRAGERLPTKWREPRYVIAKPASHHLHRPPAGHRWVRVGSDALLVVSATGIVVEIMPGLFR